jgi:hypothetical protein
LLKVASGASTGDRPAGVRVVMHHRRVLCLSNQNGSV